MKKIMKTHEINKTDYFYDDELYHFCKSTIKTMIVISHTSTFDLKHVERSVMMNDKKLPHYTITKEGLIYQHIPDYFYTNHLKDCFEDIIKKPDWFDYRKSISITLENLGWFGYNSQTEKFTNWFGVEKDKSELHENKVPYKGNVYWDKYTAKQKKSLYWLLDELCNEHDIDKSISPHNFTIKDKSEIDECKIFYRTNILSHYSDVSPAFNPNNFKKNFDVQTEEETV